MAVHCERTCLQHCLQAAPLHPLIHQHLPLLSPLLPALLLSLLLPAPLLSPLLPTPLRSPFLPAPFLSPRPPLLHTPLPSPPPALPSALPLAAPRCPPQPASCTTPRGGARWGAPPAPRPVRGPPVTPTAAPLSCASLPTRPPRPRALPLPARIPCFLCNAPPSSPPSCFPSPPSCFPSPPLPFPPSLSASLLSSLFPPSALRPDSPHSPHSPLYTSLHLPPPTLRPSAHPLVALIRSCKGKGGMRGTGGAGEMKGMRGAGGMKGMNEGNEGNERNERCK
ncbi:unnamed protein product [Closterium sp. NIES-65]|nr:unnamed protein product [Closterium sp. NIES-65]